MLYQCPCDSRVISIPTGLYFTVSDNELERICTAGSGCQISNPFYNSYAESKGVILTPEEVEEKDEQEYEEEEDSNQVDLNLPPDFYEE